MCPREHSCDEKIEYLHFTLKIALHSFWFAIQMNLLTVCTVTVKPRLGHSTLLATYLPLFEETDCYRNQLPTSSIPDAWAAVMFMAPLGFPIVQVAERFGGFLTLEAEVSSNLCRLQSA
ncbi:hypothetical protein GQX74_010124 [Glossina fuscipes]|nr:hypothetical protein GQX74_010124 [Glossina fuscipes]